MLWSHSRYSRKQNLDPWALWVHRLSRSQPRVLVRELYSPAPWEAHLLYRLHSPASLPQALHIRITCYYMSLPLDAFQRETVPLCNESCAPQATLWGRENWQSQGRAMEAVIRLG